MVEQARKFGILISGRGSNMQSLVRAAESGFIPARVGFVGSDRPDAAGLAWAKDRGIDTFTVDYRRIARKMRSSGKRISAGYGRSSRLAAESELLQEISSRGCDLICLAGFMRILSADFLSQVSPDRLNPRVMNIHPSLLPAFPGTDGYGDTWRYGCRIAGCTVHFVDSGVDTGPIIAQRGFQITPGESLESVKKRGLKLEHQTYPACVRLYFLDGLKVVAAQQGRLQVAIG